MLIAMRVLVDIPVYHVSCSSAGFYDFSVFGAFFAMSCSLMRDYLAPRKPHMNVG